MQGRTISYIDSMPLIEKMRTQYSLNKYYSQATDLLQTIPSSKLVPAQSRAPRSRLRRGFVVEDSLENEENAILNVEEMDSNCN